MKDQNIRPSSDDGACIIKSKIVTRRPSVHTMPIYITGNCMECMEARNERCRNDDKAS